MNVKNAIKAKLSQYLSNEISKENLYRWSIDILHKMLKGDIFDLRYLEVWGIITGLTEVNDMDDRSCVALVQRLSRILSGNECASFSFAIQIPQKYVVDNLSLTKMILQRYLTEKQMSKTGISELKSVIQKNIKKPSSLNEILELQIIDLLRLGYDFCDDENLMIFNLKSTVFISEEISESLEVEFLTKIITLLKCYDGERCFYVHISFINGTGNISIQA